MMKHEQKLRIGPTMMAKQSIPNEQTSRVFCCFEILTGQEEIKLGDYKEFVKKLVVNMLGRKGSYILVRAINLHVGIHKTSQILAIISSPPLMSCLHAHQI